MIRYYKGLYRIVSLVLSIALLAGCKKQTTHRTDPVEPGNQPTATSFVTPEPTSQVSQTPTITPTINTGNSGFVIDREKHEDDNSNTVKDTWTLLIYLCGTDLESEGGFATQNLEELFGVTLSDNVNIVIETGGTKEWQTKGIRSDRIERFIVEDGGLTKVGEAKLKSMGDQQTFYEFLSWGVNAYPADRIGVILWDHGSGSIGGVIYDELFNYDSLTLLEMDSALRQVYQEMTRDFEFIGFDACLMSTIETANIIASYSEYMIASQEFEGAAGWDYKAIAEYLVKNPTANGARLGIAICDSFAEKSCRYYEDTTYTLSVIELDKIDKLLYAFDDVARKMSNSTNQASIVSELARGAYEADRFGAYSEYEGYSNMIDLGLYTLNVTETVGGAAANAITFALNDAVVYKVAGYDHEDATGLSVYYPLMPDYDSLSTMSGICVSPSYLIYIDAISYGSTGQSLDNYNSEYWENNYGGYYGDYYGDYSAEDEDWYTNWDDHWQAYETDVTDNHFTFYDNTSSVIEFDVVPHLNDSGYYTMTLSQNSIYYAQGIYCSIFADIGEGELVYLGMDNDLSVDWDSGVVEDSFFGYWPTLPDNQHIQMVLVNETDEYNLYSIPISLNGSETNLRVKWVWEDPYDPENDYGKYVVVGAWDGIDSNTGMVAKEVVPIVTGDKIKPIYTSYNYDTEAVDRWYGNEYVVDDNFFIEGNILDAGDYYYCFKVLDIFGQSVYTDFAVFTIDENGDIYY